MRTVEKSVTAWGKYVSSICKQNCLGECLIDQEFWRNNNYDWALYMMKLILADGLTKKFPVIINNNPYSRTRIKKFPKGDSWRHISISA